MALGVDVNAIKNAKKDLQQIRNDLLNRKTPGVRTPNSIIQPRRKNEGPRL